MTARPRHSGIDEIDAVRIDAAGDERVANGARDRDEARYAAPVLQAAARNEGHAAGDDERQRVCGQ